MDYISPPKDHRPPKLAPRHDVYVDYLQTDDALPYPAPPKNRSEAAVSGFLCPKFSDLNIT